MPVPVCSPGPVDHKSVRQSNKEVTEKRLQSKHHWHYCANLLSNLYAGKITLIISVACGPLVEFCRQMQTIIATLRGSEAWHADLCLGSFHPVCLQVWTMLASSTALRSMNFLEPSWGLECPLQSYRRITLWHSAGSGLIFDLAVFSQRHDLDTQIPWLIPRFAPRRC